MTAPATAEASLTLTRLCRYFVLLGTTGFGGPIALVGYMQRDLVEQRGWFTREQYLEGLALSQLAPGPLAAQLAIYLGWVCRGAWGAALTGLAFVLPSFLMVLALAALYLRLGGLPWMTGIFYGVGAAVIALIARSAWKLTRLSLGRDWLLWIIAAVSGVITFWTESEIIWLFLAAGLVQMLVRAPPRWLGRVPPGSSFLAVFPSALGKAGNIASTLLADAPSASFWLTGLHGAASSETLWRIAWYFAEAGSFVFGSGLAIVPFLHAGVVAEFRWLDERQFLDAVAVAMITPGPVVITVGFIGYLVAGPVGAAVAAFATFVPCYVMTVLPAPYFRRLSQNRSLNAFIGGVTSAATGAIVGAGFVLGQRALTDLAAVAIALATLFVVSRVRKLPEPIVILAAGLVGLALSINY